MRTRTVLVSMILISACGGEDRKSRNPDSGAAGGEGGQAGGASGGTGGASGGSGGSGGTGGASGAGGGDAGIDASMDGSAGDANTEPVTVGLTTYNGWAQSNLEFVAGRDGDGAWQVLTGGGGYYELTVSTGRYGIAYVCADSVVYIEEFSVTERPSPIAGCYAEEPTQDVSGTVAGLSSGEVANICLGSSCTTATFGAPTYSFAFSRGTWDAVALRSDSIQINRIIIDRDLAVTTVPVVHNFDFGTEGFAPVSRVLTVSGSTSGETVSASGIFWPHRGGTAFMAPPDGTALFVPASELLGNDVHIITAAAADAATNTYRTFHTYRAAPADMTAVLPPSFDATMSVAATTPQVRYRVAFDMAADGVAYGGFFRQTDDMTQQRLTWSFNLSAGWLGSTTSATYTFPDLSGLAGWSPQWNPTVGLEATFEASIFRSNRGVAGYLAGREYAANPAPPAGLDGLELTQAAERGTIVP